MSLSRRQNPSLKRRRQSPNPRQSQSRSLRLHRLSRSLHLQEQDIASGIHYPVALPVTPAYAGLGYKAEQFPVACGIMDKILSLPMHGDLTDEDVDLVIEEVRKVAR